MTRLLLSLSLMLVLACSEKSGECPSIVLTGEIVNPTSDYVVLYKDDMVIDSAKLNENHHFSFNLQGIEEGLYHFDHSPELQYVYLQEGDSILIRLNTLEFDESLVFSGKGSSINNFLIEMFLAHEEEESMIYEYYKLDPDTFSHKIDSLRTTKISLLEELVEENDLTERVFLMAKASIDYNNYIYKEKYPFYHKKKTGEETIHELSDSFYKYRSDMDLNNRDLAYFRPYFDFMKYHFGNLSYMTCMKHCGMPKDAKMDHLHFNKHKLKLVDSLVQESELRDILFRNIAMDYLLTEHKSNNDCKIFIEKFQALSTNEDHKNEIAMLYSGIQRLQPNEALPDLKLRDVDDQVVSIKEISKKGNTVFYFWTGTQKRHFVNVIKHVAKLEKKYPEHNFVGISLRTTHPQWLGMLDEYGLKKSHQFRGDDFKEVQMGMIVDGLNKCVITKDTLIVDAFANLYKSF
ncbi:TlpA family protein disulfide reductase [Flagellimonas allohymeniacidonis]|uniref:Transaldolase n=1 Tax=Flagellimonas allohymeniacidonis TaxID=2517819 RepID=A0A4Q8QJV1_9FLAO|nr:transaldolase [Allomuricauda hymeniacidonis]TAI49033.1 transaldolase [Allomuricauda hymeniacidonis]